MPPNRHSIDRNSLRLLRSHPLQELHPQLLRILSHQMQRSPRQIVNTCRAHYRPSSSFIRANYRPSSSFIRANQINGLLSSGVSSIQFLPEPLVGQLIRRTLESFPVELMFDTRHNNPAIIIPSTIVESINLTVTPPTSLIPSGPLMGYKVTMIPKIEETITEIWRSWLRISHDSNMDLSTIPESFLNQPVLPSLKILSWNCRGAGNVSFLKAIGDLIHQHNPSMLILMETVISGAEVSRVIEKLGFSASFCLDSQGFSGGIWILWKMDDLEVHATSNSSHAIHAVIQLHPSKPSSIPSSANESTYLYHEIRKTASTDLNSTIRSFDTSSRGLLDHTYTRTSNREVKADLIREPVLKAHLQQFSKAYPNYYYPMLLNRTRNFKTKKIQQYPNSSRSSLMRLAKVIQGWKDNEDWETPPVQ
ncbi:hypothetical protein NE237_017392 [Protea cynaroides]|uniref:Endonuclease/exonuclease/phosphatase domain-containing protein n=1 Tax=Protea cynaroides TaxID=273540 RepID=A0A9Q0K7Y9_9MAGN|nr:hypothetical protein NE237_017392 [Protea cynaroides]